jgi:ABC-type dipeptide/oligopeptide/nickel transport system permease component
MSLEGSSRLLPSFVTARILTTLLGAAAGALIEGAERLYGLLQAERSPAEVLAFSPSNLMPWILPCALLGLVGVPWLARIIWEEARDDMQDVLQYFWLAFFLLLPAALMLWWAVRLYAKGQL